jgi:hypothetical protein
MSITNFDKVELLLPMTGANNDTVFNDYSLRKHSVTRQGSSIVTSTGRSKFAAYGSSGLFPGGSSQYLFLPNTSNFALGTGDFTLGLYVWIDSTQATSFAYPLSKGNGATGSNEWNFLCRNSSDSVTFRAGGGTDVANNIEFGIFAKNEWNHLEICRESGIAYTFLNGTLVSSKSYTWNFSSNSYAVAVGGSTRETSSSFKGSLQDVYILKGYALHTASFTPPARMTQRTLTRTNTGVDSHEYDRAVLFDWNAGGGSNSKAVIPDSEGDFEATGLIDLEYGVTFIRDGCSPVCRGPYSVDGD